MDTRVSAFPEHSESLYSQWSFAEWIQLLPDAAR